MTNRTNWPEPSCAAQRPADLDAFWHSCRAGLAPDELSESEEFSTPQASFRRLMLKGGEGTLNARLLRPAAPTSVLIDFHDIGRSARGYYYLSRYLPAGCAVLAPELPTDTALCCGAPDPDAPGGIPALLHTYKAALRTLRAARQLFPGLPVAVSGEGLGGAMALACAAQSDAVTVCTVLNPLPLDFRHAATGTAADYYRPLIQWFRAQDPTRSRQKALFHALDYLDCMNLTPPEGCAFLLGSSRMDPLSPAAAQLALFRQAASVNKRQVLFDKYAHERVNWYEDAQLEFLLQHLA